MHKFWKKLKEWYINNFVCHIVLCAATEHCYISKRLWRKIVKHVPIEQRKQLRVFFEKYPIMVYVGQGCPEPYIYRFFVNADLSDVKTPDGEEPFTADIQISRFGHIGFQSVQPTPIEILTTYHIADDYFVKYKLSHHVRLRVCESEVNGFPCYDILPSMVGEPFHPFTEEEPDAKDMIDLTDVDDE